MIPEDVRDLLEEMARKRIAGAECFIQASLLRPSQRFLRTGLCAAQSSSLSARASSGSLDSTTLGRIWTCAGAVISALRNIECIYDQRRDFSRRSTFVQQFNRPSQIENSAPQSELGLVAGQQDCSSGTFIEVFPDPGSQHQGLQSAAASAGNRSSEAKAAIAMPCGDRHFR